MCCDLLKWIVFQTLIELKSGQGGTASLVTPALLSDFPYLHAILADDLKSRNSDYVALR